MASNIGEVRANLKVLEEVPINRRQQQEITKFFSAGSVDFTDREGTYKGISVTVNPDPIFGLSLSRIIERTHNYIAKKDGRSFTQKIAFGAGGRGAAESHHRWQVVEPWYRQKNSTLNPDEKPEGSIQGQQWVNGTVRRTSSIEPNEEGKTAKDINAPYQVGAITGEKMAEYVDKGDNGGTKGGVHWAIKKKLGIPTNQPFFIEFHGGEPGTAGLTPEEIEGIENAAITPELSKFKDVFTGDKKKLGLRMADETYYAMRILGGVGEEYIIVIQPKRQPTMYLKTRKRKFGPGEFDPDVTASDIKQISQYPRIISEDLIQKAAPSGSTGYLRFEFIPVGGRLVILNNVIPDAPWVIQRFDSIFGEEPRKDEDGNDVVDENGEKVPEVVGGIYVPFTYGSNFTVYGGNRKCAINFGYIKYEAEGTVTTPVLPFQVKSGSEDEVEALFELKGSGQDSTLKKSTSNSPTRESGKRYFVEADSINGKTLKPPRRTNVRAGFGSVGRTDVTVELKQGFPRRTGEFTAEFQWEITLSAADTRLGEFTIENGRSPTLWGIRFFLPSGDPGSSEVVANISKDVLRINENYTSPSYQLIEHTLEVTVQNNPTIEFTPEFDYTKFMDRVHFVQLSAGFKNGVGVEFDEEVISFSGLMHGGSRTTAAPLEEITLKCSDPIVLLEHQLMLNSPIYDGMQSKLAVEDMALRAGFSRADTEGTALKVFLDTTSQLILPLTANITKPRFRIEDRTPLKDAILRVAKRDWAVVFCDGDGHLHYSDLVGGTSGDEASANSALKKEFFVNIKEAEGDETQVMHENYTVARDAFDAFNTIFVQSVDKNTLDIVMAADTNFASIYSPGTEGYMGFRKPFLISETALGGVEQARAYLNELKRMYRPPVEISFSTWGVGGLKSLDIIKVNNQIARIISISSELNAGTNTFRSNITAEWFFAPPQ